MTSAATRLRYSVRYRGLAGTLKFALGGMFGTADANDFDHLYGVETGATAVLKGLTVVGANRHEGIDYAPTHAPSFVAAMDALPIRHEHFTFVDYGCGKGRALLLASRYSFHEIVGVEFCRELHEIAQRNLVSFSGERQRCFRLSSVCEDASEFAVPTGKTVFYAFNPFGGAVMRNVAKNIRLSHAANPREMYFVYFNPQHGDILEEHGFRAIRDVASHRIFVA